MDRWRLMNAPGDRLEVADVEDERPQVTVPANDVERVVAVVVRGDSTPRLDVDDELAVIRSWLRLVWWSDVPLVIGRVLQELTVVIAIALWRFDLARRLQPQQSLR